MEDLEKTKEIENLDLTIKKLTLIKEDLKTEILRSLWQDDVANSSLAKILPYIIIILVIANIIIVAVKK